MTLFWAILIEFFFEQFDGPFFGHPVVPASIVDFDRRIAQISEDLWGHTSHSSRPNLKLRRCHFRLKFLKIPLLIHSYLQVKTKGSSFWGLSKPNLILNSSSERPSNAISRISARGTLWLLGIFPVSSNSLRDLTSMIGSEPSFEMASTSWNQIVSV